MNSPGTPLRIVGDPTSAILIAKMSSMNAIATTEAEIINADVLAFLNG